MQFLNGPSLSMPSGPEGEPMQVLVSQHPTEVRHELRRIDLSVPSLNRTFFLDLNFSKMLDRSRRIDQKTLDFLIICALVYAIDKIVARKGAADRWTRTIDVRMPVSLPNVWNSVAERFADAVSFLTGDSWTVAFDQAPKDFVMRRANRRKSAIGHPASPLVSLLSGGLDSCIGAIDLLTTNVSAQLLFTSHYDGNVSGPASDQEIVRRNLSRKFPRRVSHLQVRSGVVAAPDANSAGKFRYETSFRSRSLIFLGLAVYAAERVGAGVPIHIPENGPIALNLPLNPSRRGSCSTRTAHPWFLHLIDGVLSGAGISHPILNPYALYTKGEMVAACTDIGLLRDVYRLTNSCGKSGRKMHWTNRRARACGACVPCLFRRASLHVMGLDDESFGHDVLASSNPTAFADFHAVLGLVKERPSRREIEKRLLAGGRLPIEKLDAYAGVVDRMIAEVSTWLSAKAPADICRKAGVRPARP